MSWLDTFLKETSFVETPKQWLYWSGIATISAIVSPAVTVNKGAYKLKPNLFVLLVGRSGLGKGFGPSLAKDLVKMVNNTRVISGRGTIEAIVKDLSIIKARENGSIPFKDARGFLCSGEFASSLYEAPHALTVLTDLYDGHYNPTWDNNLKNSPVENLKDVCLTLLSGANQDMFDLSVGKSHRSGGFVGRTLLISCEKRYQSNSMIYTADEEIPTVNREKLAAYLFKLSKLSGSMIWSVGAKKKYDEWFYPYRDAEVDDKTGTYDRMNDHVIKVATCISLARAETMILEAEDVEEAIEMCSPLSTTARKVAGLQGNSVTSGAAKAFLLMMLKAPENALTRKQVLQRGFGDFDASELDRIIETLTQANYVAQVQGGKDIKYKLTAHCLNWWQQRQKQKDSSIN